MAAAAAQGPHRLLGGAGTSWLDVKLGLRMLVKQPGLTLVAVFALGVGIPAGLGPTHFINAALAPLPVDEGERILVLRNLDLTTSRPRATSQDFVRWREELTTFDALGAATMRASFNVVSDDGQPAPVPGASGTASFSSAGGSVLRKSHALRSKAVYVALDYCVVRLTSRLAQTRGGQHVPDVSHDPLTEAGYALPGERPI